MGFWPAKISDFKRSRVFRSRLLLLLLPTEPLTAWVVLSADELEVVCAIDCVLLASWWGFED